MKHRSTLQEWIDLGEAFYTQEEYRDCLHQLERVGRWLGGDRATFKAIKRACPHPLSILDVGCGGGGFTRKLALAYPQAHVLGIDTSFQAIEYAKEEAPLPNLLFEHRKEKTLQEPVKSYDLVVSTLVCHHLTDEELVGFLKSASRVSKKALVMNDLHRHWLSWIGFALIAPPLFNNRLITHDGLLSIKRGFVRKDWVDLLKKAEMDRYHIQWRCPFRWTMTVVTS